MRWTPHRRTPPGPSQNIARQHSRPPPGPPPPRRPRGGRAPAHARLRRSGRCPSSEGRLRGVASQRPDGVRLRPLAVPPRRPIGREVQASPPPPPRDEEALRAPPHRPPGLRSRTDGAGLRRRGRSVLERRRLARVPRRLGTGVRRRIECRTGERLLPAALRGSRRFGLRGRAAVRAAGCGGRERRRRRRGLRSSIRRGLRSCFADDLRPGLRRGRRRANGLRARSRSVVERAQLAARDHLVGRARRREPRAIQHD
jgi:hypothetical protein